MQLSCEDGAVGWGDVAPLPEFSSETLAEAEQALHRVHSALRDRLGAIDWTNGPPFSALNALDLPSSVQFGIEQATHTLAAKHQDKPLPALLSSDPHGTVSLNSLITDPDELERQLQHMQASGYSAVKLKVGRQTIEKDIRLVRRACDLLEPPTRLRLDANRAWSLAEATRFANGIEDDAIEYLEEPLANPYALPVFADRTDVPVALDETLHGLSLDALKQHTYARAIVLKPTLLGGLMRALRMGRQANALGLTAVVSAAYESGLGLCALVALAAALNDEDVPAGLDTYRKLHTDVLAPRLELTGQPIEVPRFFARSRTIDTSILIPVPSSA